MNNPSSTPSGGEVPKMNADDLLAHFVAEEEDAQQRKREAKAAVVLDRKANDQAEAGGPEKEQQPSRDGDIVINDDDDPKRYPQAYENMSKFFNARSDIPGIRSRSDLQGQDCHLPLPPMFDDLSEEQRNSFTCLIDDYQASKEDAAGSSRRKPPTAAAAGGGGGPNIQQGCNFVFKLGREFYTEQVVEWYKTAHVWIQETVMPSLWGAAQQQLPPLLTQGRGAGGGLGAGGATTHLAANEVGEMEEDLLDDLAPPSSLQLDSDGQTLHFFETTSPDTSSSRAPANLDPVADAEADDGFVAAVAEWVHQQFTLHSSEEVDDDCVVVSLPTSPERRSIPPPPPTAGDIKAPPPPTPEDKEADAAMREVKKEFIAAGKKARALELAALRKLMVESQQEIMRAVEQPMQMATNERVAAEAKKSHEEELARLQSEAEDAAQQRAAAEQLILQKEKEKQQAARDDLERRKREADDQAEKERKKLEEIARLQNQVAGLADTERKVQEVLLEADTLKRQLVASDQEKAALEQRRQEQEIKETQRWEAKAEEERRQNALRARMEAEEKRAHEDEVAQLKHVIQSSAGQAADAQQLNDEIAALKMHIADQSSSDAEVAELKKQLSHAETQAKATRQAAEDRITFEGMYRICSEFARGRGKPNPLCNPVALWSPAGDQFRKGLDRLGYSGIRELLDMPSHYIVGFHGTGSDAAICGIFKEGFDPLRRSGQVHGPGEYFDIGQGRVARNYQGNTDCCIVAIIVTKNQKGQPLKDQKGQNGEPLYKEAVFSHDKDMPICVVNNPVPPKGKAPEYNYNIPCAVASSDRLRRQVEDSVRKHYQVEFAALENLDGVGGGGGGPSAPVAGGGNGSGSNTAPPLLHFEDDNKNWIELPASIQSLAASGMSGKGPTKFKTKGTLNFKPPSGTPRPSVPGLAPIATITAPTPGNPGSQYEFDVGTAMALTNLTSGKKRKLTWR